LLNNWVEGAPDGERCALTAADPVGRSARYLRQIRLAAAHASAADPVAFQRAK
jgi:hypothetical protein